MFHLHSVLVPMVHWCPSCIVFVCSVSVVCLLILLYGDLYNIIYFISICIYTGAIYILFILLISNHLIYPLALVMTN